MNWHHIDHLNDFAPGIVVGKHVRKGDLLGHCGKSGTTSPHCHYEVLNSKPDAWLQYPAARWTLAQIKAIYLDPSPWITSHLPMTWNKLGYDFLSPIAGGGYHLGKDLNWNSGDADLGFPIYASCDGVIEYVGNREHDGGAGNNFWWTEQSMPTTYENYLVQDVEGTGEFALVLNGFKRAITADRSGLASLTVQARKMEYRALSKAEWASIPSGENF